MQDILNIIYSNTLGVQKFLSWLSGWTNIFDIRIRYLDLLVVAFLSMVYVVYVAKVMRGKEIRVADFAARTLIVLTIAFFVVGNPLSKDVGFVEGNAYTQYFFKKIEGSDMDTASAFRSGFIVETAVSDNVLFKDGGSIDAGAPTVYIDADDVSAKFRKLGTAEAYEYDKSYAEAGITEEAFAASTGTGLHFSIPKVPEWQEVQTDPRARKTVSCVAANEQGRSPEDCTDWGFLYDERAFPATGFIKLKNDYRQADAVTVEDFGRVSFLNDFSLGFAKAENAAEPEESFVIDRSDLFYWKVMAVRKNPSSNALDITFYVVPNLYSLKLDAAVSADSLSADAGVSKSVMTAAKADFVREKARQCTALGKDACEFSDIYSAKARSASEGKVNSFLSAFSISRGGFNVSGGKRRTVTINGREYLTFMWLYEMLREKSARPFALKRSVLGANFASSKNTIAFVTTDDGTPDGKTIRKAYPIGAFQQGSLYSQAYGISSGDGIGVTQSFLLMLYGFLYVVILFFWALFPIILAYTILQ